MPSEPVWPLVEEAIELNQLIVDSTGEPHTILKLNELESACERPRWAWEYEQEVRVAYLAVTLIVGIARNHPFEQGNKRTAFAMGEIFIANNGYFLDHPDTDDFGPLLEAAVTGEIEEEELAAELDLYLVELIS